MSQASDGILPRLCRYARLVEWAPEFPLLVCFRPEADIDLELVSALRHTPNINPFLPKLRLPEAAEAGIPEDEGSPF